jgi:hypothetical protein
MLSEKTIKFCIDILERDHRVLLSRVTNNEILEKLMGDNVYVYEHALYELKNELQIIEEENLNE